MDMPVAHTPPDERAFWRKLGRVLASIPFAEQAAAAWYCAVDPDTPNYVRGVLLGAIAYFVLPADMIPDILPMVGFTDDASVLATAIAAVSGHIKERHKARARTRIAAMKRGRSYKVDAEIVIDEV